MMARLGRFENHRGGRIYRPNFLCPPPYLNWGNQIARLLEETAANICRLNEVFKSYESAKQARWMLMRMEAISSCRLDGIQCRLADLLDSTDTEVTRPRTQIAAQAAHYFHALRFESASSRFSGQLDDIKQLHRQVLKSSRGATPSGEYRKKHVWLDQSQKLQPQFLGPPVEELIESLNDLNQLLSQKNISELFKISLLHAQLSLIQPFVDGNGRVIRLFDSFLISEFELLNAPILPFSSFIRNNTSQYQSCMDALIESDNLEAWVQFFLHGLNITAVNTIKNLEYIQLMADEHSKLLSTDSNARSLLPYFRVFPILSTQRVASFLNASFVTAQRAISELEDVGLLSEITGQKRNRRYEYSDYVNYWRTLTDNDAPNTVPIEVDLQEFPSWTNATKYSLLQLRQYILGAGAEEKEWTLLEEYPSLYGFFALDSVALQIAAGETDGLNQTHLNKGQGLHLFIDIGFHGKEPERVLSFALRQRGETILWQSEFEQERNPITIAEVASMSIEQAQNLLENTKMPTKNSERNRELEGKRQICEMFLAIRNVMGRRTDGDIYWEDDTDGAHLVFHYEEVRFMVYFPLSDLIGFTKEAIQQRSREKLIETIRSLPQPPPQSLV